MIRFLVILFLSSSTNVLWAQSELDKVRDMFPDPNDHIEVSIWKGQLQYAHPVEFYIGQNASEVLGYYRLISSGEEYLLEGEITDTGLSLTEYNESGEELGFLISSKIPLYDPGMELNFKRYNLDKSDVLDFTLIASRYSDFPPLAYRPKVKRFCHFDKNINHCLMIELFQENRGFLNDNQDEHSTKTEIEIDRSSSFSFSIEEQGKHIVYEQTSDKLRRNENNSFKYFILENEIEMKRISYASSDIISDVEYPYIKNHKEFNEFIGDIIAIHKKSSKDESDKFRSHEGIHPSVNHYRYKWEAWTEIDYLGSGLVTGRMIFFNMNRDGIDKEVVVFNYDLTDRENVRIEKEFKNDFNLDSYLEKFVRAELMKPELKKGSSTDLNIEDFKYLTFSENHILLSTDYDWTNGETILEIPHEDLLGLVKRNSILKTLMRK